MTFIQDLGSLIQKFEDLYKENLVLKREIKELKKIAKNPEGSTKKKEQKQESLEKQPSLFQ